MTTFPTQYHFFEYWIIYFGLFNILISFYSYLNMILYKKQDILVIIYLEDMLIHSKHPGYDHVVSAGWVLKTL